MRKLVFETSSLRRQSFYRGVADGIGWPVERVVLLDQSGIMGIYQGKLHSFSGCTSLFAWGDATTDGHTYVGRNLDWSESFLNYPVVLTVYNPTDGSNGVANAGYPAWYWPMTALNNKGVYVDLHDGTSMGGAVTSQGVPTITNQVFDFLAECDSAILEYLDGKLVIHHGPEHAVMTNSPTYDQQLAINAYWDLIGGDRMLPGTINAADRFVRVSYFLKSSPKYKEPVMAVASVFSQMRAIGVPLGMEDPDHPNISATLWRTVADHDARCFYFESAIRPSVFWVDLDNVNLEPGASVMKLETLSSKVLAGEVSAEFEPAEPFKWLSA